MALQPRDGERELREYEIDAPEEATLLDCLDIVKDRHDGTLAYRKSCRMMICGSCGMRMDGAAVLACKIRMYDVAQAGQIPVISAMGNLPIIKDLVVDMGPFWEKFRSVDPFLQPGYQEPPGGKEHLIRQERMNVIHKEALCINCGCCVSECNSMESDPLFTGPQALAKAIPVRRRPARRPEGRAARGAERRARDLGLHALLHVQRALPEGRRPARRDREARRGVDERGDRPRHGREAREVVRHLCEDDRVAARDRARAEDAGHRLGDQADAVRDGPRRQGKVPLPFPPHVAKDVRRRAACTSSSGEGGRDGYWGIVQGERALARLAHGHGDGDRDPYGEGSFVRPYLPEDEPPTEPEAIGGANAGMGSLTQADATPGQEPTHKPGGGA